ncbi:MAG: T9SS type A sorting domain-containing protein, partial [Rhodothermales bacterium]|nr:T9SS type A sorting domain-containing protein [Rhodothermales bacterium]
DVWRSGDGGLSWAAVGNVYPEALTFARGAVVGPDGRLYVTQNQPGPSEPTDGLYRTAAPVASAEEGAAAAPPVEAVSLSVWPNPSSGRATVEVVLEAPSAVRLSVYDVLGREVAVLHEGPLGAGEHRMVLDTRALPVGAYLVRAEGGDAVGAERVTVARLTVARLTVAR